MNLSKPMDKLTLQEMFDVVMTQYKEVKGQSCNSSNPLVGQWQDLKTRMIEKISKESGLDFKEKYTSDLKTDGKANLSNNGKWNYVFGISVRSKEIANVTKGVYVTYLFNIDTGDAYLTLSQAAKEFKSKPKELPAHVIDVRSKLDLTGFDTNPVNTGKKDYDAGVIASIKYTSGNVPTDADLYNDLKKMAALYDYYLENVASLTTSTAPTITFSDDELCEILKNMIKDGVKINRKNAAIATFGIVYGEFINKTNKKKILDATVFGENGKRSSENQLHNGLGVYKLLKNNPGIQVFDVLDEIAATTADVKDWLDKEIANCAAGSKEATTILFGIKNSKIISKNKIASKDLYRDGGMIDLARQIVDFIEKHPQHTSLLTKSTTGYQMDLSNTLINSKNIIFRGAPGTGKSYLAHQIAADIVSGGTTTVYEKLSLEEKKQVEFVQFHPSYDYSDFVEGLRPCKGGAGSIGFERRDGIFKEFVDRARENYEKAENASKGSTPITMTDVVTDFLSGIVLEEQQFETVTGNQFIINSFDTDRINIFVPKNAKSNNLSIKTEDIVKLLESGKEFKTVKELKFFFNTPHAAQEHSYIYSIYKCILKENKKQIISASDKEEKKNYVFIIDEINRGEISKILGELFFSIDPGYRGEKGAVSTQYANLHDTDEKFYIPENVYIIGTMNDIDRSVDTFDFAMRRRFRFIEIKADGKEREEMLEQLSGIVDIDKVRNRMDNLNDAITKTPGLNANYHIGAAYFLKLKNITDGDKFEKLWEDYLCPLLQEYVTGMPESEDYISKFKEAYNNKNRDKGGAEEDAAD